jgi:hypothetical protein
MLANTRRSCHDAVERKTELAAVGVISEDPPKMTINRPRKQKLATLNNQMTKEMVSIMYLRQGKLKVVVDVLYPKNVAQSLMSLMMQNAVMPLEKVLNAAKFVRCSILDRMLCAKIVPGVGRSVIGESTGP